MGFAVSCVPHLCFSSLSKSNSQNASLSVWPLLVLLIKGDKPLQWNQTEVCVGRTLKTISTPGHRQGHLQLLHTRLLKAPGLALTSSGKEHQWAGETVFIEDRNNPVENFSEKLSQASLTKRVTIGLQLGSTFQCMAHLLCVSSYIR